MSQRIKPWVVLVLALVLLSASAAHRSDVQAQGGVNPLKVTLPAGDTAGRQALIARGAQLISDYGAFSLWGVDRQMPAGVSTAGTRLSAHPEFDQLLLREAVIDTRVRPGPSRLQGDAGRQMHLVQFVGPVRDDWLSDLQATGAEIVAYVPYNGYVVWTDEGARERIAARVAARIEYQWHGPFQPAYRLAGPLRDATDDDAVDVVVQVWNHADSEQSVQQILAQSGAVLRDPYRLLNVTNLTVRLPASALSALAAQADVLDVEPWRTPRMLDERQGQIMAGNLSGDGTRPAGPGYLNWLDGLGFSTDPLKYPVIDVIDDGFDNGQAAHPGHADFYLLGRFYLNSRVSYARELIPGGDPACPSGHGTLNASIAIGYNDTDASLYQDADGYQYGLGISPYGRVASTKVFDDYGYWQYGGSMVDLIRDSYRLGARITNNSWGFEGQNGYTADSQAFDALTRDADPTVPGNQEMAHVFSAGNEGADGLRTIRAPGTAKNVITVGASENYRPTAVDVDGCQVGNDQANNVQDIALISSRGPVGDDRVKPDIVAPGTHIQGAASTDARFPYWTDLGVCDRYWPQGQDLYTWSSGTSHAAPAVSGALSLIHAYLTQGLGGEPIASPSPAMLKAYLLNSARYLTGYRAGDTLPSIDQGWGLANVGMALDGSPRLLIDQSVVLTHSGQVYELEGRVANPGRPFRVTLAWTDAPGTPAAAAWVNDLDLEVAVGGQTYKGNVFSGASSVNGYVADSINNVESVYLPAGISGPFTVRVIAYTVAGDGVPGNADATDQDFALVLYNGQHKADFGVQISPSQGSLCQGSQITYTVSVTNLYGYASTVSLAYSPPPSGTSFALAPTSQVPDFDAALRVTSQVSAPVNLISLTVTGTGAGSVTRGATATLAIDALAPSGTLALISPTIGITNAPLRPAMAWSVVPGARSYRVQVSRGSAFSWLDVDRTVTGEAFQPTADLAKDTTYHWRVTAQNGCGSILSTLGTFTTVNQVRLFYDDMELGSSQWSVDTAIGKARWALSDRLMHGGQYAWHMAADDRVTDARLATYPAVEASENSTLSFWQWYDLEATGDTARDGGVLEAYVGGKWQDLGPYVLRGGYTHTIAQGVGNPLAGRSAWSGQSGDWQRVEVDLSPFAGSALRIRFRWAGSNDNAQDYRGWYVDDVQITSIEPPSTHRYYIAPVFR